MKLKKTFKFLIAVVMCGSPYAVFAHATPVSYDPGASAVMERMPTRITIQFTERLEKRASSINVYDSEGVPAARTQAFVDEGDARMLHLDLVDSKKDGIYAVTWSVVSADDGHFTRGAYSFAVGVSAVPPTGASIAITHTSSATEAAMIWLELFGQALLVGWVSLFLLLLLPFQRFYSEEALQSLKRFFRFTVFLGVGCVLIGGGSYIVYKSNDLLSQGSIEAFGDALRVFSMTVTGRFTLYRMLAALLMLPFALKFIKNEKSKLAGGVVLALLVGMIFARARVSHAAASHILPMFSVGMNTVHLFFKDLWIGGLFVFVFGFIPAVRRLSKMPFTASHILRFSKIMTVAFVGGGVTGIYIIWLHLKDFSNVMTTDWGGGFAVLSVLTGGLIGLRMIQQVILDRRIASGKPIFLDVLYAEVFLGTVLLFATSTLIITTPPVERYRHIIASHAYDDAEIALIRSSADEHNIELSFNTEHPVTGVTIVFSNSMLGIEGLVVPVEQRFENTYAIPIEYFSPAGQWHVDVTGRRDGAYDAVASFDVRAPQDFIPPTRRFGLFDLSMLVGVVGLLGLGILLWWWTHTLERMQQTKDIAGAGIVGGGFVLAIFLACALWLGANAVRTDLLKTTFQRSCEDHEDMWHVMPPMRYGKTLSSTAVAGCMTTDGQFHFTDEREYRFHRAQP